MRQRYADLPAHGPCSTAPPESYESWAHRLGIWTSLRRGAFGKPQIRRRPAQKHRPPRKRGPNRSAQARCPTIFERPRRPGLLLAGHLDATAVLLRLILRRFV